MVNSSFSPNKYINLLFINVKAHDANFIIPASIFLTICIVFLGLSIFLFAEVSKVSEASNVYYKPGVTNCTHGRTCNATITVTEAMNPPVRVMFKLGISRSM